MRKIPKKNYIIAIIFVTLTLLATYILANTYLDVKEVEDKEYMNFLSQIMPEELDNFIVESHDGMIYMTDNNSLYIDKVVKKVIVSNDYVKDTVYIDLSLVDDNFYNTLSSKYNISREKLKGNNLVIIKNQKIVKVINLNEENVKRLKKIIKNFYEE